MKRLFLLFICCFLLNSCSSDFEKIKPHTINGIWYSEVSQPLPNGLSLTIKGTSEYFGNGGSNSVGQYILPIHEGEHIYQVFYNVIITGEWTLQNNKLIEKLIDIKSHPVLIQRGQSMLDLRQLTTQRKEDLIRTLPNLNSLIPKGMTTESKIIYLKEERMALSTPDGQGGSIETIANKVKKPFQFAK